MQGSLQNYSEIFLILLIADFIRGGGVVLFSKSMLKKCLDILPYQLKTQLCAAEDTNAWRYKAFGCLFAPLTLR